MADGSIAGAVWNDSAHEGHHRKHRRNRSVPRKRSTVRRGLRHSLVVALTLGMAAPVVVTTAQPALEAGPTITVDRTDDTAAAGSACTAAANDCSLRGAVLFANAHPGTTSVAGTTISIPAGTYQLTIAGSSGTPAETDGLCHNANVGDLDVAGNNTIISGDGAASTIIQQTTSDRV